MDIIERYYRFQTYTDIGWTEFSWFTESFLEIMGIMYFVENAFGIVLRGHWLILAPISFFVIFYNLGKFLKKKKIYDTSVYVDADIDPVKKEMYKAAKKINGG